MPLFCAIGTGGGLKTRMAFAAVVRERATMGACGCRAGGRRDQPSSHCNGEQAGAPTIKLTYVPCGIPFLLYYYRCAQRPCPECCFPPSACDSEGIQRLAPCACVSQPTRNPCAAPKLQATGVFGIVTAGLAFYIGQAVMNIEVSWSIA